MSNDTGGSIFKASLALGLSLLKGLLVPFSAGVLMWAVSWPIGYISCTSYAEAIEHPYKYKLMSCYIQTNDGRFLEKSEYQSSELGMKIKLGF